MPGIPNIKKGISLVGIPSATSIKQYPTGSNVISPGTDGYILQSDSTSATGFSWVSASGGGGGAPSGPAGGDLTGSYPNPTLAVITASTTVGSSTVVPVVSIDNKGRVTSLTSATITGVPPSGDAGGDLTGSYPNPTLKEILTGIGPVGNATTTPVVTVDNKGRITAISSATISGVAPGGSAGGDLTGSYPNPTLKDVTTATTYISTTTIPSITLDAKGRITNLSSASIQIAESQVTNLTTDLSAKVARAGDTMTGPLTINYNGTGLNVRNTASNGIGSLAVVGKGNGTEYSNFYLQDENGYPSGHLWSFSMRNDKSFLFFSYGGAFVNVMCLQQNGGIRVGNSFATSTTVASNVFASSLNIGAGLSAPTARLHISGGSATAGTAPLKFNSGPLLTSPESGSMEYDGNELYFTTGSVRKTIDYRRFVTSSIASHTASVGSCVIASGSFTITLPSPSISGNGAEIVVKKTSTAASTITISASVGTIDGATTQSLTTHYSSYTFVSDGSTNWWII